jgi:dehydrogenase/reductase SDR family protein 7B
MSIFKDKVVWITGASSGIGEALAKKFAASGAKLVLSARRINELERVKKSLELPEERVLILPLDLSDTTTINTLTQQVLHKFGCIDVLVNNGGISQRALTKDAPLEIDRKIMEVNFFGTVAITKSVLPYFLKQQSGQIIVISSISGKFGFYFRSAYSASKHALHGFFESLRMEVDKDNIKVLLVCPGKIRTNISVNAVTASGEKHNKMDPGTDEGMNAEQCALKIIQGVEKGKEELFIGGKELKAVWIKRFFPGLFSKLIKKQKAE